MPDINRTQPDKPNNHMVMTIVSTALSVITCTFTYIIPIVGGIVGIVFASQVNSKYNAGDFEGAEKASKYAKIAWIVSIVSIVAALAYTIIVVGASWDEFMDAFNQEMERQKELQGQ